MKTYLIFKKGNVLSEMVGIVEVNKSIEDVEETPLLVEKLEDSSFHTLIILEHAIEPIGKIYTTVSDLHFPHDNRYIYKEV